VLRKPALFPDKEKAAFQPLFLFHFFNLQ
jgi:hypothetical protein